MTNVTLTAEQAQQIDDMFEFVLKYPKAATNGKAIQEVLNNFRAAREQEQRPTNCGTGYCSCIECPYEAEQVEQELVMDYERINALREGEQNGAEDAYFFVRPENDTPTLRKMFCQGFERGFHKGLKYAAPVRTKDLTPHEITALIREGAADGGWQGFAQRVIAADREKNK